MMSELTKKLSNSYLLGLSKSMDMQNNISILEDKPSTIKSSWEDVGNAITSAMKTQNQSIKATGSEELLNKLKKFTNINESARRTSSEELLNKLKKITNINESSRRTSIEELLNKLNKSININKSARRTSSEELLNELNNLTKVN
jgi:preprotein translocase subunit Sss1